MAEEEQATEDTVEPGGGKKKMLVFAGIGLLLVGAAVFGGMMFLGDDAPVEGEEVAESAESASDPALYTSLHPPLVVNFKDSVGDSHYMQVTMEVMSRDQNVINSVREHTPVIRNSLILLYSGAIYDEVTTRDGKEKMLQDGLVAIQEVMTEQIGEPGVEAVYFTALVIQ